MKNIDPPGISTTLRICGSSVGRARTDCCTSAYIVCGAPSTARAQPLSVGCRLLHARRHCLWSVVYCVSARIVCGAPSTVRAQGVSVGRRLLRERRHCLYGAQRGPSNVPTSRLRGVPRVAAALHAARASPLSYSPACQPTTGRYLPERSLRFRLSGVPVLPLASLSLQRGGLCEAHRIERTAIRL